MAGHASEAPAQAAAQPVDAGASAARRVTASGARQCSLSAAQVEEIYAKLELPERRHLAEWALAQRGRATVPAAPLAFSDGARAAVRLPLARR